MPFAFLFFFLSVHAEASRVRTVEVKNDQIVIVNTAVGVATIIQVPDRPASLVVGDSEAFKIEYLDQAITIKPLRSNAKSNLYIYTDWKRFNVQLVAGAELAADYVVYLTTPKTQPQPQDVISWREVEVGSKAEDLNLTVQRLGRLKNEYIFIEFSLAGKKMEVDPKWFWLTQRGISKPIHRLLLSTLSLNRDGPIEGLLQIRLKDLLKSETLSFEIRRKKNLVLKIPGKILWK